MLGDPERQLSTARARGETRQDDVGRVLLGWMLTEREMSGKDPEKSSEKVSGDCGAGGLILSDWI
jgi:hypothetical protein